jgi:hypothetical protein
MTNINALFISMWATDTPTIREIHLKNEIHNLCCGDTTFEHIYKLNYQCNSCPHKQHVGFQNYSVFYLVFARERFKDVYSIFASAGNPRTTG